MRRGGSISSLAIVLCLLGAWSTLPPYVGPPLGLELSTATRLEVADHVVPGVIVVIASAAAFLVARRPNGPEDGLLLPGAFAVCFLGGLWETTTHVPLLFEGGERDAPWGAVLLHSTAGPPVLVLSLLLLLRTLAPAQEPEPGARRGAR